MQLPKDTVFYKLEKAIKLYRRMAQSEIHKADSDLTVNQLILLIEIEKNPNLQQIDLAELIFKDVASVTRMTDLLFKKGHLRRKVNPKSKINFQSS